MSDFLTSSNDILFVIVEHMTEENALLEGRPSKLTPYQKAQRNRRQTVATHTHKPAKASTFYVHAVRAIFQSLRKRGESFKGSAKGGQNIARHMLTKYGYAMGNEGGGIKLTGKGRKRNAMHTKEPAHIKKKKQKAYDYILGIQRKVAQQKAQVVRKAAGAG